MVETKSFHGGDTRSQLESVYWSKRSPALLRLFGKRTLYWSKKNAKNHGTKFFPFSTIVRFGKHNTEDSDIE